MPKIADEQDTRNSVAIASDPFEFTIVQGASRPSRLAKKISVGADGAWRSDAADDLPLKCSFSAARAASLGELHSLLGELSERRDLCIIRGQLIAGTEQPCRRLLLPRRDAPATLLDVPRSWLLIDVDSVPAPEGVSFTAEPARCAEYARSLLPVCFRSAACVWHASGSAGFKDGIRLHLWFMLDRPLLGDECKAWLQDTRCDRSIHTANQPNFTADPELDGVTDPMVARLGKLSGAERVHVPAELPQLRVAPRKSYVRDIDDVELQPRPEGRRDALQCDDKRFDALVEKELATLATVDDERKNVAYASGCRLARAFAGVAWDIGGTLLDPREMLDEALDEIPQRIGDALENEGCSYDADAYAHQAAKGFKRTFAEAWTELRLTTNPTPAGASKSSSDKSQPAGERRESEPLELTGLSDMALALQFARLQRSRCLRARCRLVLIRRTAMGRQRARQATCRARRGDASAHVRQAEIQRQA